MALQAQTVHYALSAVPGLQNFWKEAEKPPSNEWQQRMQFFEVAVLARYFILSSLNYSSAHGAKPKISSLYGHLRHRPNHKKNSVYISIGKTGIIILTDKMPQLNVMKTSTDEKMRSMFLIPPKPNSGP